MRWRWKYGVGLGIVGLAILALSGCIAELAAPELVGGEIAMSAAEFGAGEALGAELVGAELAEIEGAEGLVARGMSVRAGVLRPALAELRASGAPISIESSGAIRQAGRYLATLESDGSLVVERGVGRRLLVGKLEDGSIWQAARGGGFEPVGRLRGFVPGRGIRLRSAPTPFSPAVEILRPNVSAEVVSYRAGWFEVRLLNGERGYVWSPFVALSMVLGAGPHDRSRTNRDLGAQWGGCPVLTTGRLMPASLDDSNDGAVAFTVSEGERLVVDRELCLGSTSPLDVSAWDWSRHSSQALLSNGGVLFVKSRRIAAGATVLELADNTRIVADPSLIKGFIDAGSPEPPTSEAAFAMRRRANSSLEGIDSAPQFATVPRERAEPVLPPTARRGTVGRSEPSTSRRPPINVGDLHSAAPPTPPWDEASTWRPQREWIRWANRQRVLVSYCREKPELIRRLSERLHKLGATVVPLICRGPQSRHHDTIYYSDDKLELARALQGAMSGLRGFQLEPQRNRDSCEIWLR